MIRIVNITYQTFFPNNIELVRQLNTRQKVNFEFTPLVLYNQQVDKNPISITNMFTPINQYSLYEEGVSFAVLKRFFGRSFRKDELTLAKKAFDKLRALAIPSSERVIADVCSQIILNNLKQNVFDQTIFFIQKLSTEKMLGRLSYLYLNLKNVTICFLSFQPDELITTVMTKQSGKLHFDLNRLVVSGNEGQKYGPYPSSPEDALEQAFFYTPSIDKVKYFPLRFDIFSQGLTEKQVDEKSEIIKEVLNSNELSIHHQLSENYAVKLPIGFSYALNAWNQTQFQKESIQQIVEKQKLTQI